MAASFAFFRAAKRPHLTPVCAEKFYERKCCVGPLPLRIYLTRSAYQADLVAAVGASGYEFILHMKRQSGKHRSHGRTVFDG